MRDNHKTKEQLLGELAKLRQRVTELEALEAQRKRTEEAERRQLEQKAQVANRLAIIGEMAAGIGHEINNPLTAVIGFAHLLLERDIPEDIREDVEVIHRGARRVASIVNRLLTFARQQKPERAYVSINDIIENTVAITAYELEASNITLSTRLASDLPWTMVDSGRLQQVFLNMIMNARTEIKTVCGRGNIFVKTEVMDNSIRVSFKGDGSGITREVLERIFAPFFTTREVGYGTGLGLSVCHRIITEHGGRIHAESEPGEGATFTVELPIVAETQ